jgi:hypothetical protein
MKPGEHVEELPGARIPAAHDDYDALSRKALAQS